MRCLSLLLVPFALVACGGVPSHASSTFESDDEGWTLSNNGEVTRPTLVLSGGNPGAHLCGRDEGERDLWYFVAPPRFLGNASASYGKRLTFDLKQGASVQQLKGREVVLNGGGLALALDARFTPGLDWTPYSFRLDTVQGWYIDEPTGKGPAATEQDLKTVLGDLRSLRLRGEFYDGLFDTACLDNVYLGRE